MIKATEFHDEFLKQVNRVNTDYNKRFSVSARDSYFNRGMDVVLENFMAVAEINTTVRNHLRQLEIKKFEIKCTEQDDDCCKIVYPDNFYRLLRQEAVMTTTCCDEKRKILVHTIPSSKVGESLRDPYWKPSFEWEETIGEEAGDGYLVYKDKNHKVESVFIDYMKKPKKIAAPSLLSCSPKCYINSRNEKICEDQDFEVDSTFLWRKIVDVSVLYALRDIGQIDDFSAKMNEILFIDKLYLK